MVEAARKYGLSFNPLKITSKLKRDLPAWYHPGRINDAATPDKGVYAECLRNHHKIYTVGALEDFVLNFHEYNLPTNRRRTRSLPTCDCPECDLAQTAGCLDAVKCHMKASEYLN